MSALPTTLAQDFQGLTRSLVELAGRACAGASPQIASDDVARAMTALVKLYAAKAETEASPPAPVTANNVTPTEVVLVVSEMLRAVDISLFDLAMWYRRGQRQ
jgi:hypothetical protein